MPDMQKASDAELYVIMYDDPQATFTDKKAAEAEVLRRHSRKHGRLQNKERKVYPR